MSWFHMVHQILSFITCALISAGWDLEMLCTLALNETRYCIEMKHRLLSKWLIAANMLDGEKNYMCKYNFPCKLYGQSLPWLAVQITESYLKCLEAMK